MSATWSRVVVGGAAVACVLGVGVLEVVSERVHVDKTDRAIPRRGGRTEPALDSTDLERGPAADAEAPVPAAAGGLTSAVQTGRLIVLKVDEPGHRLVSLSGVGRVLVTDAGKDTVVVTGDGKGASLGSVKPGDVVRVEPTSGFSRRIVVLRRGWQELESPEQ